MKHVRFSSGAVLLGMAAMLLAACGGAATSTASVAATSAAPSVKPAASAAASPAGSAKPAASAAASAKPAPSAPAASASAKPAASTAANPAASGGPNIKVGILDDVTGVGSIEGAELRINADIMIQQTNASGGINGRQLEPVYVDPKGDPAQALQLATQLVQQDKVDVLAGAIFSSECLGIQQQIDKFGLLYLPLNGCANEQLTAQSCNRFTFRVIPAGKQVTDPVTAQAVKSYGKNWGIIYPDYAFGQSQVDSYSASLQKAGGNLAVKIAIPLNETNVTPYISKIPTDGSIDGLINTEVGTDLARVLSVVQQFGINKKLPIMAGGLGRESYGGVYPDGLNGFLLYGYHQSNPDPNNKADQDYFAAFADMAKKDSSVAGPLGGPDKATPGINLGYSVFASMNALKLAMRAANFTGKADTDKLISAFEGLSAPQGPDFPAGPMIMSKSDHQGRLNVYVMKINGQKEDIIQTITADQLPPIGTCQVK